MDPSSCSTLTSYPTPLIIPGAIFYSDFDDNTTNITGKSAPGTWFGSAQYTTGKVGQGANLNGSSYIKLDGLPVNTAANSKTTVAFWMRWGGSHNQMPFGFRAYDLYLNSQQLGFNTGVGDFYGNISSNSFANTWVHVVGVFNNGNYIGTNKIYINGVNQHLPNNGAIPVLDNAIATSAAYIGWWGSGGSTANEYKYQGLIDEVIIWNRELTSKEVMFLYSSYK